MSSSVGSIPGRKLEKWVRRDCQSCGKSFRTNRDVPYCLPCFKSKRARG